MDHFSTEWLFIIKIKKNIQPVLGQFNQLERVKLNVNKPNMLNNTSVLVYAALQYRMDLLKIITMTVDINHIQLIETKTCAENIICSEDIAHNELHTLCT